MAQIWNVHIDRSPRRGAAPKKRTPKPFFPLVLVPFPNTHSLPLDIHLNPWHPRSRTKVVQPDRNCPTSVNTVLKLTKKADYGLIALKHLAVNAAHGVASAKEIAETYHIPLPLLAKVLQKLNKSGLLRSEQGTNGGYRLARDPREISTLDAIRTIDGPIILTHCFTEHGEGCSQSDKCTVREPLRKVHEGLSTERATLLCVMARSLTVAVRKMAERAK